jgi:hypothetical protein
MDLKYMLRIKLYLVIFAKYSALFFSKTPFREMTYDDFHKTLNCLESTHTPRVQIECVFGLRLGLRDIYKPTASLFLPRIKEIEDDGETSYLVTTEQIQEPAALSAF